MAPSAAWSPLRRPFCLRPVCTYHSSHPRWHVAKRFARGGVRKLLFPLGYIAARMHPAIPFTWTNPRTWPWIVYVWFVFSLAALLKPAWAWYRRRRSDRWTRTEGRVESTAAHAARWPSSGVVASVTYSYSVEGMAHAGIYKKEQYTLGEAEEFIRDLQGKPVEVRYNPRKPSKSVLAQDAVQNLLRIRSQISNVEASASDFSYLPPRGRWGQLWFLAMFSGAGFILSLTINLAAWTGRAILPSGFFIPLHLRIFVAWAPAILGARLRVGSTRRKDFWRVMLRGAPRSLRYMLYAVFAYGFTSWIVVWATSLRGEHSPLGSDTTVADWKSFSSIWMIFYFGAYAILCTAAQSGLRCVNGHPVPDGAKFCPTCGQPVHAPAS